MIRQNLLRHWRLWAIFFSLAIALMALGGYWLLDSSKSSNSQTVATTPTYACNNAQMTVAQIAAYRNITVENIAEMRTKLAYTPNYICIMPDKMLERSLEQIGEHDSDEEVKQVDADSGEDEENDAKRPDEPDKAWEWRKSRLEDENGFIPADGVIKAQAQIKQMSRQPKAAGITTGSWTWAGPGNIGGRSRSMVIDPSNAQIMYIGSIAGGIWKTTNGGTSWTILSDFLTNMAVSTMVMDPNDATHQTIYVGTGEGFYNGDATRGNGIFKTTNGGTSWTQVTTNNDNNYLYVNRLAINPTSGRILAATRTGVFYSDNGGTSWNASTGIVSDGVGALDVKIDPNNSTNAVVGGTYGRVYYSTDSGLTWTAVATGWANSFYTRTELSYASNASGVVYASVGQNNGELWKSTNGGQSYSVVNTGSSFFNAGAGSQSWYDNTIWVDPTNSNVVIIGGVNLFRSTNGGTNFTAISQWQSGPPIGSSSAHADQHFIIEQPGFDGITNKTVFFLNDGGIFKVNDVYAVAQTSGWINLNNNYGVTQFYGAAGNSASGKIVAGAQDNGHLLYNGSTTWAPAFGGDGGNAAYDPSDANYFYGEYVYLRIHRNTTGGASSSQYIYTGISDATNSAAEFIAPFILDPNNSNTLLGGGASLWRSTNVKVTTPSWTAIKSPIGGSTCSAGVSYAGCITAIAVAPGNSDVIWVGYQNGQVWFTTNGTAASPTWNQANTGLPARNVTRLAVDPTNSQIVYVTFGGFSSNNVWRSSNSGTSWTAVSGPGTASNTLPQLPVYSIVINQNLPNWLYVGTELGTFTSQDSGATWTLPQDGPTNTPVYELFWINKNKLGAATHGRGVFTTSVDNPLPTTTSLSPNTIASGNATFTLTVNGSNFVSGAVVNWNASPLTTTFINNGQLTATVPAALVVGAGTANITVTNPTPGGGTSTPALVFTITGGGCNPLIVSNTTTSGCGSLPAAVAAATSGQTITFSIADGSIINLTAPLNLAAGVNITANCNHAAGPQQGPAITVSGTGVNGPGLFLNGNNAITGLRITGFNDSGTGIGKQIHAVRTGTILKNSLNCVKAG